MKGVFISGTDTDAGKTQVACALIREWVSQGWRVAPFKPVAAGAELRDGSLRNADALALIEAAGGGWDYDLVNPYCFEPPIAPHLAAAAVGRQVRLSVLVSAAQSLASQADVLVVEGAGGWMVPLGVGLETSALVQALQLPVLLVVGLRLGCINHARLSEMAIRASGCELAGWLGSEVDPEMRVREGNLQALDELLQAPRLGYLAHMQSADAFQTAWQAEAALTGCLDR